MKRIWVMTVGLLLGSSSSVWAEQTSSTSDYLKNMNQLYEFAWSLQYTQEGPYDIWLVHDEQGITKSQSNFPQSVLGYQIEDFDQDNQKELLVASQEGEEKKCLSPAKKYKLYKSSINKSLHFAQRSLSSSPRGHRVTAQLNLSGVGCGQFLDLMSKDVRRKK